MKRFTIYLALLVWILLSGSAMAADPMFSWDPSPGATGYIIYGANAETGVTQANPMIRIDVGNVTTYPVLSANSPPGVEFNFAVSAYNTAGESGLSNVVSWTRPAFTPPQNITLPPIQGPATVTVTIQVQ